MNYCYNKERFGDFLTLEILQTIYDERLTEKDLEWFLQHCRVYSWPQMWSNTACGFPGMAGQAFTTAQTTVFLYISDSGGETAIVYHADRFAYAVTKTNEKFTRELEKHSLIGAQDYVGQYETDK